MVVLFIALMLYKVTANTETANTELLLLGRNTGLDFRKPLVTFSSADPYITIFVVWLSSETSHSMYVVNSLTLNSQPTGL